MNKKIAEARIKIILLSKQKGEISTWINILLAVVLVVSICWPQIKTMATSLNTSLSSWWTSDVISLF